MIATTLHRRTHNRTAAYAAATIAALLLSGCGRPDSDPAAGGLTVGESAALDKAAERLDARTPSPAKAEAEVLEGEVRARLNVKLAESPQR